MILSIFYGRKLASECIRIYLIIWKKITTWSSQNQYQLNFSLLKSNKKSWYCQNDHSDTEEEDVYDIITKCFIFFVIIGIEAISFLDLTPIIHEHHCCELLERDNIVFLRNDVTHYGTEHITDHEHYCAYFFIKFKDEVTKSG